MTRLTCVRGSVAAGLGLLLVVPASGDADRQHAPPPPVAVERPVDDAAPPSGLRAATTEWSHGDPSDEEQLFLELMNRARLDPQAEADRVLVDYGDSDVRNAVDYFLAERPGVEYTRAENHDAFDALPAVQPLAFDPLLAAAAHAHSVVMRTVDLQVHQAIGEAGLGARISAEGYEWSGVAESIFAFAKSMTHAHAGFAVDWGQGVDGGTGRPTTGHRSSLMSAGLVQCGVGVIHDDDPQTSVGPLLITIDFATPRDTTTRYVTGVVYDDRNGNAFYDPGEGIAGARIETDASDYYAVTSTSGGYAVPVPADAGTVVVFAGGQVGTPSESVGSQQAQVNVAGQNVKVDFGPLPAPPLPTFTSHAGSTQQAIGDGATLVDQVTVGALSPDDATVGDLDVVVFLDHDDRAELRLTLTSPAGTELVLFDGAPGGKDLRGAFDTTLRPTEPLAAFVGEAYQGTWTLRVTDAAGGVTNGVLERWFLVVRPGWVRNLHAPATPLAVKTLKIKDSTAPGKDKVVVKAELDAGGYTLNAEVLGGLRLLDAVTGAVVLAVDLPLPFDDPDPAAPVVKAKVDFHRNGSSRSAVTVKVSGIDLVGPIPATTRVELTLGASIVADDVTVASGKATGVAGRRFFVDGLKSVVKGDVRSSIVKGRFSPGGALGVVGGVVEVVVGDARFAFDASALAPKGSKLIRKSAVGLRKLVVDTRKGTFSAKVESAHEILVDDTTPVALRLGDGFYGATNVRPYEKGTKTLY